jgi:hypothetical protein
MAEKRSPAPRLFSNLQIMFSAILAISLLLAISFSGRIAAGHKVEAERDNLLNEIGTLRAQATALRAQYDYVNSDAFIENWTHGEGKMVKSGEVLVVPVPGKVTPQPTPTPLPPELSASPTPEAQTWTLWWRLFFDSPPPNS